MGSISSTLRQILSAKGGIGVTSSSANINSHTTKEKGEKSNKCSMFIYASIQAGYFRRQLKTHCGEKWSRCNPCDYITVKALRGFNLDKTSLMDITPTEFNTKITDVCRLNVCFFWTKQTYHLQTFKHQCGSCFCRSKVRSSLYHLDNLDHLAHLVSPDEHPDHPNHLYPLTT